jgi:hypothetical protein
MAPQRALADLDISDVAEAIESIAPGSGTMVSRDLAGKLNITWQRSEAPPDEATIRAAIAALPQKRAAQEAKIAGRRQRLRRLAEGAVGKDVTNLSQAERNAVVALFLERNGVLDDDGAVRPLAEWS